MEDNRFPFTSKASRSSSSTSGIGRKTGHQYGRNSAPSPSSMSSSAASSPTGYASAYTSKYMDDLGGKQQTVYGDDNEAEFSMHSQQDFDAEMVDSISARRVVDSDEEPFDEGLDDDIDSDNSDDDEGADANSRSRSHSQSHNVSADAGANTQQIDDDIHIIDDDDDDIESQCSDEEAGDKMTDGGFDEFTDEDDSMRDDSFRDEFRSTSDQRPRPIGTSPTTTTTAPSRTARTPQLARGSPNASSNGGSSFGFSAAKRMSSIRQEGGLEPVVEGEEGDETERPSTRTVNKRKPGEFGAHSNRDSEIFSSMVSAKNDGTQRTAATSNSSTSNHGNQDSTNSLSKESNHSNVDMDMDMDMDTDMDGEDPASAKDPTSTYISTSANRLMSGSSASAGVVLDKSQSTHSAILLNETNDTNEDMPTQLVSRTNSIEISITPMIPTTDPEQTINQDPPVKQLTRKESIGPSKGSSKHLDSKNVVKQDTGNTTSIHSVDIEAQTTTNTTTKPTLQEPAPNKNTNMVPIVIVAVLIVGGGIAAGVVLVG